MARIKAADAARRRAVDVPQPPGRMGPTHGMARTRPSSWRKARGSGSHRSELSGGLIPVFCSNATQGPQPGLHRIRAGHAFLLAVRLRLGRQGRSRAEAELGLEPVPPPRAEVGLRVRT